MKTAFVSFLALFLLAAITAPTVATAGGDDILPEAPCRLYSDDFSTFRVDRWKDVLYYSESQGMVFVRDGQLVLESTHNRPCEIQIYSLFTFEGDFDIQAAYHLDSPADLSGCRLNAGLVLQTLADELSYKCYVSTAPGKELFFRTRLDRHGEMNLEKQKFRGANPVGIIRIVRKNGQISMLAADGKAWRQIHVFTIPTFEPLRVRLKMQTSPAPEEDGSTCPASVRFDDFSVNRCTRIDDQ